MHGHASRILLQPEKLNYGFFICAYVTSTLTSSSAVGLVVCCPLLQVKKNILTLTTSQNDLYWIADSAGYL